MTNVDVLYYKKGGQYSKEILEHVKNYLEKRADIKDVIVATTRGETGVLACEMIDPSKYNNHGPGLSGDRCESGKGTPIRDGLESDLCIFSGSYSDDSRSDLPESFAGRCRNSARRSAHYRNIKRIPGIGRYL